MRHIKLIIALVVLVVGGAALMRWSANDPSVRGQDANVETRGTNTAGMPGDAVEPAGTPQPGSTATPAGTSGANAGGDAAFVADAAGMNATETALADLAQRNATDTAVKRYAAELHRDHTAAARELSALAARKQWAYPAALDILQAQALQGLQRAEGPAFDRAFVEAMVASHERAIQDFRTAAASASDAELKAFAAKQLPVLEAHLQRARNLQ